MVEQGAEVRVVGRVAPEAAVGPGLPPQVTEAVAPHRPESLHPGAEDPSLASWFVVTLADPSEAEAVASRLRELPEVDAAYVEPPSAPPG